MKRPVLQIARKMKKLVNNLSDQILIHSMFLVVELEKFPEFLETIAKRMIYFVDDVSWLLHDFPNVDVFKFCGDEWNVIFIGREKASLYIRELFFKNKEVIVQQLPRIRVWKLPKLGRLYLETDADLVICELSRLSPWKPTAEYSFSVPDTVVQMIDLPEPLDDLLSGGRIEGSRRWIRKAERQGLDYRFTRSMSDLEFFHNEMYVPFISKRHAEMANISSLEAHTPWFKHGGLILVSQAANPIGGSLVARSSKVCHFIEYGILNCDDDLLKNGAVSSVIWSSVQWAKGQGAEKFDLGGSRPWCSNGTFQYKSKWGAHVERHILNSRPDWVFLSNRLPDSLRERINQIGIISELKGRFYCTYIPVDAEEVLDDQIQNAIKNGLSGILKVQKGSIQPCVNTTVM